MAITYTPRFNLPKWNNGATDGPARVQFNAIMDSLERYGAHDDSGAFSARPAAGNSGNYYFATDQHVLYRDNGTSWELVGTPVGVTSDVHTQVFSDTPSIGTASKGYAAADHSHGMPANPITAHLAASNPHPQYSQFNNFSIPFHIANTMTVGLKVPKWIATQNCLLRFSRAVLNSGSGSVYRIYVNGIAATGMVDSDPVFPTVSTFDFADIVINAGDRVQIYVVTAGSAANDLSVTIDGVWR